MEEEINRYQHIEVKVTIKNTRDNDNTNISSNSYFCLEHNTQQISATNGSIENIILVTTDASDFPEPDFEKKYLFSKSQDLLFENTESQISSEPNLNSNPKKNQEFMRKYALILYFTILGIIDAVFLVLCLYVNLSKLLVLFHTIYLVVLLFSLVIFFKKSISAIYKLSLGVAYIIMIFCFIYVALCDIIYILIIKNIP